MSRLTDRIAKLNVKIEELQGELETLKAKQDKVSAKRRRKAYRKKLARDPMFRAMMSMVRRMNRDMFESSDISMHTPLTRLIP